MLVIGASRLTCMLSVKRTLQNFGLFQSDSNQAVVSADMNLSKYNGSWKITRSTYYEAGMTTFTLDFQTLRAQHIQVTDDALTLDLHDGRTISVPLGWYPRLLHGTSEERQNWRFIGDGVGVHWPDLDEDISIENIVLGRRSGESQQSFQRWLDERASRHSSKLGPHD